MLKVEDGPVKTLGTQREKGKRSVLFALTAQCQAYNLAWAALTLWTKLYGNTKEGTTNANVGECCGDCPEAKAVS